MLFMRDLIECCSRNVCFIKLLLQGEKVYIESLYPIYLWIKLNKSVTVLHANESDLMQACEVQSFFN